MKRFWMADQFIDEYAKDLSFTSQAVFMALSRHANKEGFTFVGCRRLAQLLGMNKSTVSKALRELEQYGIIVRYPAKKRGGVSWKKVLSVRNEHASPSASVVHKEEFKELNKKEDNDLQKQPYKGRKRMLDAMKQSGAESVAQILERKYKNE